MVKIPKGYANTMRYSYSKATAQRRANKARKVGYLVRLVQGRTKSGRVGYVLFAKTKNRGNDWFRR